MANQLTSNAEALRLFFTEDIYLLPEGIVTDVVEQVATEKEVEHPSPITEILMPISKSEKSKAEFKYLGKNLKSILILVNDDENDVSTETGRELLRKLVKAIDLTANDFALVNYSHYKEQKFNDFKMFFNCKVVLAFGVKATDLDLPNLSLHQLVNYDDIKFVFTTNLDELDRDQPSKKLLWSSLQQLKS